MAYCAQSEHSTIRVWGIVLFAFGCPEPPVDKRNAPHFLCIVTVHGAGRRIVNFMEATHCILEITPIIKGIDGLVEYWRIALLQNLKDKSNRITLLLEPHAKNEASGILLNDNNEPNVKRIFELIEINKATLNNWAKGDKINLF